jgi:hypothetical protein
MEYSASLMRWRDRGYVVISGAIVPYRTFARNALLKKPDGHKESAGSHDVETPAAFMPLPRRHLSCFGRGEVGCLEGMCVHDWHGNSCLE